MVLTEKEVDRADERDERDVRKGQKFHGRLLLWLAYQSIGVIYGDIGTSPLYVYSSTFSSEPSHDDLLGALSLVIWSLTLMVSIKYILIVLRADDEREGGTFAIYSLLTRYANILHQDPREKRGIKMERVTTAEFRNGNRQASTFLENSRVLKAILKVIGVLGVSLVMSDGVLRPAQSVLGAVQGLEAASDNVTKSTISVPPGMLYPSLAVAILTAIVASQTMITATFQVRRSPLSIHKREAYDMISASLVNHQAIILSPDQSQAHFEDLYGQMYIPWVNWLLMIGAICITAAYSNTTKLGEAYGVCVILVTFITTSMVSLVTVIVWRLSIPVILAGFLVFSTFDGLYLFSALTKVPEGAWFTLCLAVLLSSIFVLWRYGKENQWAAEAEDHILPAQLLDDTGSASSSTSSNLSNVGELKCIPTLRPISAMGSATLSTIDGIGIFFDKAGLPNSTPTVFVHFVQKFQAMPTVSVFFNIRPLSSPSVPPDERFSVSRVFPRALLTSSLRHIYRITVRHGYTDNILTNDLGSIIYLELRAFIIREGARISEDDTDSSAEPFSGGTPPETEFAPSARSPQPFTHSPTIHAELRALQFAHDFQVIHIVGEEQMRISTVVDSKYCPTMGAGAGLGGWTRKVALAVFLWLRSNTGRRVANMEFLDPEKVVEVGWVKMI